MWTRRQRSTVQELILVSELRCVSIGTTPLTLNRFLRPVASTGFPRCLARLSRSYVHTFALVAPTVKSEGEGEAMAMEADSS